MKCLPGTALLSIVALIAIAPAQQQLEFDAATLKLSAPSPPGAPISINLGTIRNDLLTLTNTTLSESIQFAFGIVSADQIVGPEWIRSRSVRFDVVAKAPPG